MKFLITGACGFIGSNLTEMLLKNGHEVVGVDAFTQNYPVQIKEANRKALKEFGKFELLSVDLLEAPLHDLLEDIDVIFHLAGHPSVSNSWGDEFQTYVDRNIVLTQRLLRAAVEVETPKFVNSSSSSIYGKVAKTPTIEGDEKKPVSPYGVTKLAAENLCTLFGKEYGLPTVSLRYFTVYGPRQRPDMAFNKIIKSGLEKSEFHLYGDGSQVRDFTFVSDVAQANLLAATSEVEPGSVFNIGGGSPVTMTYAIEKIQEILGVEILIEQESFGLGNPMITEADCSAARESLNWHPKVRIDEGLALQIEWQRSSYEGLSF